MSSITFLSDQTCKETVKCDETQEKTMNRNQS